MTKQLRHAPRALGSLALLLVGASCTGLLGDSLRSEFEPDEGAGGDDSIGSGAGTATSTDPVYDDCSPPCQAPQFCSLLKQCLDPGKCLADDDCAQGTVCDEAQSLCVPGGDCGAEEFTITAQTPNMMIVLDRSGSMGKGVPNSGKSRWQVAAEAVASVLANYEGKINFGLDLFSACTGNGCAPGTIVQPIGSGAAAINQSIQQTFLCNSGDPETVIGGSLSKLVGEPTLQAPDRDNVVLLLTDGHDNCGGGGAQAATALLGQPKPVKVYVVGFSGDVNVAELQSIAQAAGTAPYYQADDAQQLNAIFQSIAEAVATCTYTVSNPSDEQMYVFFNNNPNGVPSDPTNGWTYDPASNTLEFVGQACADIKNGVVKDIDVVFGCAAPTPD